MEEKSLSRRADEGNNVTIPLAISIGPSQYWDGNDGPWSSIPLQLGGGNIQKQNVRVFPSTAAYNTWVINAEGCPDWFGNGCANSRGFLYNNNESLTYIAESIYDTEI